MFKLRSASTRQIIKIEGVFSGTLSYIFNEFSKVSGGDVKFSEVVKIAKDLGYTVSCTRQGISSFAQTPNTRSTFPKLSIGT
jgi:homoserine dehydrogenase